MDSGFRLDRPLQHLIRKEMSHSYSSSMVMCRQQEVLVTTGCTPALTDHMAREAEMARPERFELPTARFVVGSLNCNLLFNKSAVRTPVA